MKGCARYFGVVLGLAEEDIAFFRPFFSLARPHRNNVQSTSPPTRAAPTPTAVTSACPPTSAPWTRAGSVPQTRKV